MAEIGRWGGHRFTVSSQLVLGFEGLSVKGGSNTDDKESDKSQYVTRKNGKPTEVGLTVSLNAFTGADVQAEAMAFVEEARTGKSDYFYLGGEKMLACRLMLVDAVAEEIELTARGVWKRANIKLTLKQCDKTGGGSGGGGGGTGKKISVKATQPAQEPGVESWLQTPEGPATKNWFEETVNTAEEWLKNQVKLVTKYVNEGKAKTAKGGGGGKSLAKIAKE